jgi:hypothetical protein
MASDSKRFGPLDLAVLGGAGLAFIAGFLPWWGYDGPLDTFSASVNGWSTGFTGWAGTLLLTLAGVYLLLRRLSVSLPPALNARPGVTLAGTAALGLLLVIIRWASLPSISGGLAGSIGSKYGIWVAMIGGLVEVAGAVLALRASGEPLPWGQASEGS